MGLPFPLGVVTGRSGWHGGRDSRKQLEDRAFAVGPAFGRCPVEVPIDVLDQPRVGDGTVRRVEAVQRLQLAARGDCEDRPVAVGPATLRCPVEIPIGVLD